MIPAVLFPSTGGFNGMLRHTPAWLMQMLLVALLCGSAHAHNGPSSNPFAVIPGKAEGIDLAPYLLYWHDRRGNSSFDDALLKYQQGAFNGLQDASPNLGFRDGNNWFYFSLKNGTSVDRMVLMEVDYAILDQLEFYCFGADQQPRYTPAGDHIQYDSRLLKLRNFVVPLNMQASAIQNCMVRVRSSTNIMLPIRVYDNLSYVEHSQWTERLLGIMYGIALALLVYNLVQYFSSREWVYFYFSLHVIGGVLYMTFMDGTLSELWIALELQDTGAIIAISLSVAGALLFGSEFLELRKYHRRLYQVGNLLFFVAVAFVFAALVAPLRQLHIGIALYTLLTCCYLILIGIYRWLDGHTSAPVFLLGFGIVFLMTAWVVLNLFVLRTDVRWITYGVSAVWVCELIVLSVALGSRLKIMEKEHRILSNKIQMIKDESLIKTEFMAKVSHEIRTPMNGVLGLTELILGTSLDKDQKRYVTAIQNAGKGLLEVISDILDYSKIEAGKMKFNSKQFDLQSVLSDACAIYEYDARFKGIELGCFISPGTPLQLVGDVTRIRQIILNTLSNAFKYTEKGYVHINVQLTDQIHNDKLVLRFEVEDSGIGITQDDQTKLFQSFSQLDQGWNAPRLGVGLGLVISQQFAQLMGGEMGVQSEPGDGSCFWFHVPLGIPDPVQIAEHAIVLELFDGSLIESSAKLDETIAINSIAVENAQPEILVVEDNEINQNVIVGFLKKMGLDADMADNGRTAMEKVQSREQPYDLILMDCEMPVMDGYEAASRIIKWQKAKGLKNCPIIALSAHVLDKHRNMALEAGMVDYIAKPISYDELNRKIIRFLNI